MKDKMTSGEMNLPDPHADHSDGGFQPRSVSPDALLGLEAVAEEVGGAYKPQPETEGAVAFTHSDSQSSEDNTVTILLTREKMDKLPSQALVHCNIDF
jgi:hypothetical protein